MNFVVLHYSNIVLSINHASFFNSGIINTIAYYEKSFKNKTKISCDSIGSEK